MFKHAEHIKQMRLEREIREREIKRNAFGLGLVAGVLTGYCLKKFVAPKIQSCDYHSKLNDFTDSAIEKKDQIKDSAENLKDSVIKKVKRESDNLEESLEDTAETVMDKAIDEMIEVGEKLESVKETLDENK